MIDLISVSWNAALPIKHMISRSIFPSKNIKEVGQYGQLTTNFDEMRQGDRVSEDEYEKECVADFALWKARVPDDGEIYRPACG